MSKVIQRKHHWIHKVHECAVVRDASGELNVELRGGAENGEFAYVGEVKEDAELYQDGKLCEGELLLEVEGLSVAGLPLYDIYTVMKCCHDPIRLTTVRQETGTDERDEHGDESRPRRKTTSGTRRVPRRRTVKRSTRSGGAHTPPTQGLRPWDPRRQLEGCNPDKERGRRVTGTYREATYTQRRGSYPACAKRCAPFTLGTSAVYLPLAHVSLSHWGTIPPEPPHPRLRRQDRENPPSESALRDQLLLGLSDSPLAQALKVYARRHPELDFTELREEARLLETEYGRGQPEVTCASVQKHYDSPKTPQGLDWKEQLKREIMEEVNVQMKGLSRDILAELKPLLQSASPQSSPPNTTWNRRYSPRPYNDRDEQGMNVIMACWDNIFKRSKMPALPPQFKHLRVWREAFATCSRIEVAPTEDGSMGFVRLATKNNISVPPNSEIVVWGRTRMGRGGTDFCALIEPVPGANIGGVGVARTLVEVRKGRVPVRICNPHPYSVSVGRFTRLGQLYHIEEADVHGPNDPSLFLEGDDVVAVTLVDVTTSAANSELPPEVSKLKTRPDLSEVQQEELEALLQRWEKVFAVHDEDFGRTDLVQHRIPTGDAAPIRERHRPIPPMLYREAIPPVDELVDAAAVETGRDGHGRTGRARRREQATEEDHERDPSSAKEANREAIYTQRRGSYPAYAVSLRPWDPRRQLEGCNPDKERGRRVTGTYREATYTQRRGSYPACAKRCAPFTLGTSAVYLPLAHARGTFCLLEEEMTLASSCVSKVGCCGA
uniref:PDZ domain-containing protein n=1 Tax=Knipowitschia caucasica TaxID=637954 RepID=A0AAV2LX23_KNICA